MPPCDWPLDYGPCGVCPELDAADEEETDNGATRQLFEDMAVDLLWRFTDRQFGVCDVTLRPCAAPPNDRPSTFTGRGPHPRMPLVGANINGQWRSITCGCTNRCNCTLESASSIRLPGPVASIESVSIDGQELDPSEYRLMYGDILVRADRSGWPITQDLLLADDAPGTFTIVYGMGVPVPAGGRVAAARLACQLAKAHCGSKDCALPERIQTITRQGVTVGIADAFEGLERGRTGIWSIDAWIESVVRRPGLAAVHSPDVPRSSARPVINRA